MTGRATMPTRVFLNDSSLGTMLVVRRVQVSFRTLVRGGPRLPTANSALSCHRGGFFGAETDELHERFCSAHINAHVYYLVCVCMYMRKCFSP